MTNAEAIRAFVDMLKAGDHEGAAARFNAPDIVSIEAMEGPMARIEGAEGVRAKAEWWYANHDVHGVATEGPFVNGDQFAVVFDMDITVKATGQRMQAKEVGVYTMKDGKVVEEKFLYSN
jgi:ketosteroid isomerase-like protein